MTRWIVSHNLGYNKWLLINYSENKTVEYKTGIFENVRVGDILTQVPEFKDATPEEIKSAGIIFKNEESFSMTPERLDELKLLVMSFKEVQGRIKNEIVVALDRLSQIEDEFEKRLREKTMVNLHEENISKINTLYNNAVDFHEAGKYREAIEEYRKVLTLEHNHYNALSNIGCAFDDLGDQEQALFYLKKAIELKPVNSNAHYNCGYIYKKQKEYHLAIKEYTSLIKFNSLFYNAYEDRGECYVQIGKYDNALEDFRNAVILRYPEYDPAELVTLVKPDEYDKWATAYGKLITAGFLPYIRGDIQKCIIIGPYRTDRIILKPQDIYVKKSDKRHLKKIGGRYELCFDAGFNAVMDRLDFHYMKEDEDYMVKLRNLYPLINQYANTVKFVSVALYMDGQLAAGDLGILAKKTYLSLTGFHDAPSAGSAQLILLAGELVKKGIELWDFGTTTYRWDAYKLQLGAQKMTTENYQKLIYSIDPASETIFTKKYRNQKAENILGRMSVINFDIGIQQNHFGQCYQHQELRF